MKCEEEGNGRVCWLASEEFFLGFKGLLWYKGKDLKLQNV
jgi:hypothetical protein